MRFRLFIALTLGASAIGCQNSSDRADAAAPDAPKGPRIPPPGTYDRVDTSFDVVVANDDTPANANPLGVASKSDVFVWIDQTTLSAGHMSDYFVFETDGSPGVFGFGNSGLCYSGNLTGITATLWKVANTGYALDLPIGTWVTGATSCMKGSTAIEPNTVYLFGVTATGTSGSYSAC